VSDHERRTLTVSLDLAYVALENLLIALENGGAGESMLEAVTATAGDLKESIAEYWQTVDPFVPDEPLG
jgi:hypothetical protein